ncbi:nucleotide sugar dehydrogenase [Campylobacter sp. RM12327]|uniref:nucleotide sugar dehydrogenase n=1 Tax=Campylobacter sputorum TaxID=206 RepID=UPI000B777AA8|nr:MULTISPECIES: nucleotide sugar dehydrogenase [Campylobacter]ASM40015.1 polysaccharide biosynthesis protein, nucleotide sugar dehydrogenase, TviB family [Campylobacter sputorum]MBE7358228.1 nucleotide sugar dehydrogenase [Campylobacter sp. RM11302]MBF6670090.1 nucleotide sugar dehydrogenase [Campylobacter sp. RM12327]MBF6674487.1 nucleotide sugar dehydrogenase [Campylobacter sp. RM13538]MBF6676502.1 nucleotide sugar dehydrogenase [Campylobacter sp. RM12321]
MTKIAIIGLGYVGLPLAVAFSNKFEAIGYDINKDRIKELQNGSDKTLEINDEELKNSLKNGIKFSSNLDDLKECNFFIIAVPTPVDKNNRPDLTPLLKASQSVASVLKKEDIVVYESTVYPGATEEECVPVLEKYSNLKFNKDFFCGYSPERINPGDKEHTITKIKKITSGSTPQIADKVDEIYSSIIEVGTFKASSIKVAEAAKVIENTQRDINIAFVNELAMIFEKIGIDTKEVLKAAGTKWNFLKFSPGLVGGHCIGVDPYYLTHKARELGYHPEIILAGRRINDNMGKYVANRVVKLMIKHDKKINNANVLILGITFKENCTDIRNSRVIDVISELKDFGCVVDVFDPWADKNDVLREYNINLLDKFDLEKYEAIILAVAHNEFKNLDLNGLNAVTFDIKGVLEKADERL